MTAIDAGTGRGMRVKPLVTVAIIAPSVALLGSIALLVARAFGTWPNWVARSVEACEIIEVYCWMISPRFGNIRLDGKATLDRIESRRYVLNPRACEAALRALRNAPPRCIDPAT